jgi:hypothetical protein
MLILKILWAYPVLPFLRWANAGTAGKCGHCYWFYLLNYQTLTTSLFSFFSLRISFSLYLAGLVNITKAELD